jgi:hypothetical protein
MCADIIADMASETAVGVDRLGKNVITECLVEAHRVYRSGPMRRELILSDVVSVLRAPKKSLKMMRWSFGDNDSHRCLLTTMAMAPMHDSLIDQEH